jgi:hypothetical protein
MLGAPPDMPTSTRSVAGSAWIATVVSTCALLAGCGGHKAARPIHNCTMRPDLRYVIAGYDVWECPTNGEPPKERYEGKYACDDLLTTREEFEGGPIDDRFTYWTCFRGLP